MSDLIDENHEWATGVGRILIAFGAIEGATRDILSRWCSPAVYKYLGGMSLENRIRAIVDLSEDQDIDNDHRIKLIAILYQVKTLAHKRNQVAHNPLALCLFEGRSDLVPVIGSPKEEGPIIDFEELQDLVLKAEQLELGLIDVVVDIQMASNQNP